MIHDFKNKAVVVLSMDSPNGRDRHKTIDALCDALVNRMQLRPAGDPVRVSSNADYVPAGLFSIRYRDDVISLDDPTGFASVAWVWEINGASPTEIAEFLRRLMEAVTCVIKRPVPVRVGPGK